MEAAPNALNDVRHTDVGAGPTSVRWRIFLVLLGIVTLNYVDRGSLSVALPMISRELHISPQLTGLILSSFFWTYALMQIPGGWLADRYRPRIVAGASCVGWGLAQTLIAVASNVPGLIALRLLLGAAEAPVYPAGGKLNAVWLPPGERGRGAVLLDGGAPLGAAIGGVVVSGLIVWTGSWRLASLAVGLLTIVAGLLAWRYIRNTPREHPAANAAECEYIERAHREEDAGAPASQRAGLLPYLRFRSFWAMCLGWMGFNGVFYGLLTWGPLYLSETKGFDISAIGWSTLAIFGAGFVGELTGGVLSDRWKARGGSPNPVMRTLLGIAGVAVVAGLFGVVVVPNALVTVALLAVVLFFLRWAGLYWSVPTILAGRDNAGVVGGAMNLFGNIAGIVTPIVVGLIVGATGSYTGGLLFFVGAGVLFTVCSLTIDYRRRLPA
jgi:ACS family D-galactonate transporter-like MFS transporter